jgi:hypothetical protein
VSTLTVYVNQSTGTAHVVIDVNGYYAVEPRTTGGGGGRRVRARYSK